MSKNYHKNFPNNPKKEVVLPLPKSAQNEILNFSFAFYKDRNDKEIVSGAESKKNISQFTDLQKNTKTFKHTIDGKNLNDYFKIENVETFTLSVKYPGLLTGLGYMRTAFKLPKKEDGKKEKESDYQFGFNFDHTTGLPYIAGSTVKGILKHSFNELIKNYNSEISTESGSRIKKLNLDDIITLPVDVEKRKLIIKDWKKIFFGDKQEFHDAYIANANESGRILEDDYIAPHPENHFKNPTPLRFLKIASGVNITFQFKLKKSIDINIEDKLNIFKNLIVYYGIGAKRNSGYGTFRDTESEEKDIFDFVV